MPHASIRTTLPLAIVTCTSMLAMDLFLPAVPTLQRALGIGVEPAQATIAVFLVGLAASQLLWAEALARWGPRRTVQAGLSLLVLGSTGCALAPQIAPLLAMRLVQGVGAGAATVVAPTVVRATLSGTDAVRGLAAIAMIESIVPAVGPVVGAALLGYTSWRGTFWLLAATTLLVLPFVVRVTPAELPGLDRAVDADFRRILSNGRYVRLASSQALAMGALLTFVASAPQLVVNVFGRGASAFAALQVIGVAGFAGMASQAGRISHILGPARAIQVGAAVQLTSCAALAVTSTFARLPFAGIAAFWAIFCGALAVRGPASFSEALDLPPSQMGRASAIMVLAILLSGAVGTQAIAPFMDGRTPAPLALGMFGLCIVSAGLVMPYPRSANARR